MLDYSDQMMVTNNDYYKSTWNHENIDSTHKMILDSLSDLEKPPPVEKSLGNVLNGVDVNALIQKIKKRRGYKKNEALQ